jgi:hypothetical protein
MSAAAMPTVPSELAAWARESRLASRPAMMFSARAAMHEAARMAAAAPVGTGRRFRVGRPNLESLRRHPVRLTFGSMAAAAVLVVASGWNAGPGSPLHPVQLAREDASLALAGSSQAVSLRLDYAEARLRDASAASDRSDNLAEAAALLNAARQALPASHADPLWQRWSHDESLLVAARAPSPPTPANLPGHDDGQSGPGGSDDRSGGGPQGTDGGGGGPSTGDVATPSSADGGGGGSDPGQQSPPAGSTPASDGGGGGDGSSAGSDSSTSGSSPSTGDSGGDGGGG